MTVVTGPLPLILQGVPALARSVTVEIDRPEFVFNPTDCDPKTISATIDGSASGLSIAAVHFQATDCAALQFKPRFSASTDGHTSKADGASLDAKLVYPSAPPGTQANFAKVKVDLPKQLPARLTTLQKACPAKTFEANPAACPAASAVAVATATTPLLPVGLSGPAYFVSYGGAKFPELIVVLQGDGVTVYLHGETFISKGGITSSTFPAIPDVPVGSFELRFPQGPDSALAANGNLCKSKSTLVMPTCIRRSERCAAETDNEDRGDWMSTRPPGGGAPRAQEESRAHQASRRAGEEDRQHRRAGEEDRQHRRAGEEDQRQRAREETMMRTAPMMCRASMFRAGIALGVLGLLAGLPGLAAARPVITLKAEAVPIPIDLSNPHSATYPGTGAIYGAPLAMEAELTIGGTEYGGSPAPLTGVRFYIPAGVRVHPQGFSSCSETTLKEQGAAGCPEKSFAGALGAAAGVVSFGESRVHEQVTLQPFFAPGGGFFFYVVGDTPALIELISKGSLSNNASPPFGMVFTGEVPLVESVPGALDASVEYIKVKVGAAFKQGKKLISYATAPSTCPKSRFFPVKVELSFLGGETAPAEYRVPCPKRAK